nr:MAG TPA: Helix-turn-helix XRE-family like protein [Caudoviricetes sp.]
MEDTLKELCREARDRQNITIQDLADETGISISTIGNFFASKSKAPNVYNAGAICAALGVSLDEYFGIEKTITTEDELVQVSEQLKHQKQIHDADVHIANLEGSMEQMAKTIDYQRKKARLTKFAIYGLMLVCSMFMAVIVGYIFFDYRVPNQGLIQGGEAGVFAWIVFLLLAVGIGIFAAVFIVSLRYTKEHTPTLDI